MIRMPVAQLDGNITSIQDYEYLFRSAPRGDGGGPILGPHFTAFVMNDWIPQHAGQGNPSLIYKNGIFIQRENRLLLIRPDISSDPSANLATVQGAGLTTGQWWWGHGGCVLPNGEDIFMIGDKWSPSEGFGTNHGPHSVIIRNAAVGEPSVEAVTTSNLPVDADYTWDGAMFFDIPSGYMYHYGHHVATPWAQIVARKPWDETHTNWEWRTSGGAWSTDPGATLGGITFSANTPIRGISGAYYDPVTGIYHYSSKVLDSAPGLGFAGTEEIHTWTGTAPYGTFTYDAVAITKTYRIPTTDPYAARVLRLPNIGWVAYWSTNTDIPIGDPDFHLQYYGLHFSEVET